MELQIYNIENQPIGKVKTLHNTVFAIEPNDHAIYLDVKQYRANKRQGTHKTKERADITGSTKKLKKQKGTGTARAGNIKSPIFRGGGRAFGPRPRDYSFKLNKKVKQLARKSALSYKVKDEGLILVEDFNFDAPKTNQLFGIIEFFEILDKKTLIVLAKPNNNIYLSSRNLQGVKVVTCSQLTTYDLIDAEVVLFTESAIDEIHRIFNEEPTEAQPSSEDIHATTKQDTEEEITEETDDENTTDEEVPETNTNEPDTDDNQTIEDQEDETSVDEENETEDKNKQE